MSFLKRFFGRKPDALDDVLGPVSLGGPVTAKPPLTARPTAEALRTLNWANNAPVETPPLETPDAIDFTDARPQAPLASQPVRAALRGLNWDNRGHTAPTGAPTAAINNSKPTAPTGHPAHTVDDVMNQFAWD